MKRPNDASHATALVYDGCDPPKSPRTPPRRVGRGGPGFVVLGVSRVAWLGAVIPHTLLPSENGQKYPNPNAILRMKLSLTLMKKFLVHCTPVNELRFLKFT